MQVRDGFNVYGYLTSNVGLGVAARNTIQMLLANNVPVAPIDVNPGGGGSDPSYAALIAENSGRTQYDVNLFHLNPDRLRYMISPFDRSLDLEHRLNVCVPFWEAPRLPRTWLKTLSAMDVILAPTLFVRDAVLADLPDANVVHYPQTVLLPSGIEPDRERWGIPPDAVAFVTSFAIASDVERKNPWVTLEAFEKAFTGDRRAVLVVKVNNPAGYGHGDRALDQLRIRCAAQANVVLIEAPLSYVDVLSLYDSCDVLVSLHRSEGLGLSLLEGMSLGKTVIGTAWSGNMDFMTEKNSALVPFRLIDIDVPKTSPYHPRNLGMQTQWADADVDVAASWMFSLADRPELRAEFGKAGRSTAEETRSAFESGEVLVAIDEALAEFRSGGHEAKQTAATKLLRRTYMPEYAAHAWRGLVRRVRAVTEG